MSTANTSPKFTEPALEHVIQTIHHIRQNDLDFLTVDTVQTYTLCSAERALEALTVVMGVDWVALKL